MHGCVHVATDLWSCAWDNWLRVSQCFEFFTFAVDIFMTRRPRILLRVHTLGMQRSDEHRSLDEAGAKKPADSAAHSVEEPRRLLGARARQAMRPPSPRCNQPIHDPIDAAPLGALPTVSTVTATVTASEAAAPGVGAVAADGPAPAEDAPAAVIAVIVVSSVPLLSGTAGAGSTKSQPHSEQSSVANLPPASACAS